MHTVSFIRSLGLGLLLGTEAPVVTPNGANFFCTFLFIFSLGELTRGSCWRRGHSSLLIGDHDRPQSIWLHLE